MSFESVLLEDLAAPQKNAIVGGPFGSNLVSKDYVDQGTPVIRGQNMGGRWVSGDFAYVSAMKADALSPNKARPGDLIFTQRGTLGQVSIVPSGPYDEYIVSQSQMKATLDPERADVHFLYYVFRSPEQLEYIQNTAIQTGVPHTNLGILKKTPLKLPSIHTQRQIATILGALDDRIDLLRETNATLEAIAQALFKSWFVDFDPVRAKMAGRAPEGMDEATAALFPDALEETELGLVPRGWRLASLSSISTVTMGLSPKGESYNSEGVGIPLINGPVEFGEYFPVRSKWTTAGERLAKQGDLIFCVRGSTTGRRVIADDTYCIGRGVCSIRAHEDLNGFLYQTINFGLDRLLANTTGSVFPSLSGPDIKGFQVLAPSVEVMRAYEQAVAAVVARQQSNQRQIATLAEIRDQLLPRLISGQLRLPEAQAQLEEALA